MTSSQNQPTVEKSSLENQHPENADNLPFAFARRFGVMVNESDDTTISLTCRKALAPSTLLEIQRLNRAYLSS